MKPVLTINGAPIKGNVIEEAAAHAAAGADRVLDVGVTWGQVDQGAVAGKQATGAGVRAG